MEYVATSSFRGDMVLLARGLWATLRGAIKTKFLWRRRHRVALFAIDSALIVISGHLALLVRYDFVWPADRRFYVPLLLILGVRASALMYYGAYQGVFAYFGLFDLMALFKALTVSALIAGGLTFFVGLQSFPRSVFVIDWAMILFLLAGVRYSLRAWVRHRWREKRQRRQKALVVGAGVGGEQIARTLLEDPLCPYRPVGFIDERPERWGSLIHGVRVLGGATELPLAVSANKIDAVFVCMSDLTDSGAREVVEVCETAGVEYRIVPALSDLLGADAFGVNGRVGTTNPVPVRH
jgi:FlaA1/EpsC-like NDP-sugar epimerase